MASEVVWSDPSRVRQDDRILDKEGHQRVVVATLQGKAGTTLYLDNKSEAFYPRGEWALVALIQINPFPEFEG